MSMIDAVRRRPGAELAVDTRGLVTFWLAFADLLLSPLLILASITDGVEAERSGVERDKVRERLLEGSTTWQQSIELPDPRPNDQLPAVAGAPLADYVGPRPGRAAQGVHPA